VATRGGTASALAISGCASILTGESTADSLTVGSPGGPYQAIMQEQVYTPFEEQSDITIEAEAQPSTDKVLSTIRSNVKNNENASIDVLNVTTIPAIRGQRADLWMKHDDSNFENIQYINEDLLDYTGEDEIFGIGSQAWVTNIVANANRIEDPPISWTALWDSEFEGQIGLNSNPTEMFLMDIAASIYFDGSETLQTEDGIRDVMEKLERIKPQVKTWWSAEASFLSQLKNGQTPLGQMFHDIATFEKENGAPIQSIFPDEGGVLGSGRYLSPKTSDKQEAIQEFIDYAIQPEVQDRVSKNGFFLPTIKEEHVGLSEDFYSEIAGPGLDKTIKPSYSVYIDNEQLINQLWDELLIN